MHHHQTKNRDLFSLFEGRGRLARKKAGIGRENKADGSFMQCPLIQYKVHDFLVNCH